MLPNFPSQTELLPRESWTFLTEHFAGFFSHAEIKQIVVPLTKERNWISMLLNFPSHIASLRGKSWKCLTKIARQKFLVKIELFESMLPPWNRVTSLRPGNDEMFGENGDVACVRNLRFNC